MISILLRLPLPFARLGLPLAGLLLLLSNKIPQHPHLLVVMFIEVEAKTVPESYLEEIVIQTLLGNANFDGRILQGVLLVLVLDVTGTCVVLTPFDHFVDDVSDPAFLSTAALILDVGVGHLQFIVHLIRVLDDGLQ